MSTLLCASLLTAQLSSAQQYYHPSSTLTEPVSQLEQQMIDNIGLTADKDWVQLTSGEILHGKIEELFYEKLTFKSKDLGTVSIKLSKIHRLYSPRKMALYIGGLGTFEGSVLLDGNLLSIDGSPQFTINPAMIVSLHARRQKELDRWENKITLSANAARGNSESIDISSKLSAERTTYRSRTRINYTGILSVSDGQETDRNHRLTSSYDIFQHSRQLIRPLQVELYHAPLLNIDLQTKIGSQIGYELLNSDQRSWELFAGPSWQRTHFRDVADNTATQTSSLGATISSSFQMDISRDIELSHDYDLTITEKDAGQLIHHNVLALNIELTDIVGLDIDFIWDRTESPTPDSSGDAPDKDDYRLTFGIGVDF
ncbi:DUF481 domain-containing protein [Thaumasiovibrio sp. DFM-14]|uniref:DUF481 domain-containing protein n=1 Tax=Thaumasiovibrio sp. DFM-14 TaxID=3384792 RepID=UPI00399F7EE4